MLYRLRALLVAATAAATLLAWSSEAGGGAPKHIQKQRAQVVKVASRYLGREYTWGASGPRAFDCSGFTAFVYQKVGVRLPHNAAAQHSVTRSAHGRLRRGDLLYFHGDGHVGIYIGKQRFIHASSSRDRVVVSRLSGWYRSALNGTGRIFAR